MIILDNDIKQAEEPNPETAVLIRAKSGDETAWTDLIKAHQDVAFRLAYLLLGHDSDAEDVTQDAFVRAYRYLDSLDVERPFRPWLLRIVRNQAYNHLRSAKRYFAMMNNIFQQAPKAEKNSLPTQLDKKNDAFELWQAVQTLKPKAREVIYLRYFLELSEKETAETLNIPKGTVKSRTNRALASLRPIIEQKYPSLKELL